MKSLVSIAWDGFTTYTTNLCARRRLLLKFAQGKTGSGSSKRTPLVFVLVLALFSLIRVTTLAQPTPQIRITQPAAGAVFVAPATIPIATVIDDAGSPVHQVTIHDGPNLLATVTNPPFSFAWSNVGAGYHTLVARAINAQGVTGVSPAVTITVRPANDNLINGTVITGQVVTITDNNFGATFAGDPRWADNQGGHSVWYAWTAPATESVLVSGRGQGFDLLINVLAPDAFGNRVLATANALAAPGASVAFAARAGRTYFISADGYLGEEGSFTMTLRRWPPNDAFADRLPLNGDSFRLTASNEGATQNVGEPNHAGTVGGRSLWWSWTAPASGPVTLSITDQAFTPLLAVYTDNALNAMTVVASNSAGGAFLPSVTFTAVSGATYHLAVDGAGGGSSSFALSLEMSVVRISSPADGLVFKAPANLTLAASTPTDFGPLRRVEFFNGPASVGTITGAGGEALWTNVTSGWYALTARAEYESGLVQTSRSISVLVNTNESPPAPQIAAGTLSASSYWLNPVGELFAAGDSRTKVLSPVTLPEGVTAWTRIANDFGYGNNGTLYRAARIPVRLPNGVSRWVAAADGLSNRPGGYSFGLGDNGVLYFKLATAQPFPAGVTRWLDAGMGFEHALALGDNGHIYTWGNNFLGQLGIIDPGQAQPRRVALPAGVTSWKSIAVGGVHYLAIGSNDKLYAWGFNYSGQLGIGNNVDQDEPTLVAVPAGVTTWQTVAAGEHFSLGLANNGQIYSWGRHWEDQLGIGYASNKTRNRPVPVNLPDGVSRWLAVAAGDAHALALGNDCRLYSWGANTSGQLGIGVGAGQPEPAPVFVLGNVCGPVSVRLIEPSSGALFHAPEVIRVTAVSNFMFGALQAVEFVAGSLRLGEVTNAPYSLLWSNPPPGRHWITARARDRTGVVTISSAVDILVNARPEVALISPTNGATLMAGGSFILAATAADPDGQVELVEFFLGTNLLGRAIQSPFTIRLTNVASGRLVFTARATDNLDATTTSFALVITMVPNQPPGFTLGADPGVFEDSGPQTAANWATNLTPGPAHEAEQALAFIVTNDNPGLFAEQPSIDLAGTLRFAPAGNANGVTRVLVTLRDNGGTAFGGQDTSAPQTFAITVQPVNDPPLAYSQSVALDEDATATIKLDAIDVDGDALTFTVGAPAHGTLTGTPPNLTYRSNTNYFGPESFTFSVSDGQTNSEIATVSLTVRPVNDAPVAEIVLAPLSHLPGVTNLLVIAPVGTNATVILDGSRSTDVENDPLQYFWSAGTFATGVLATNRFARAGMSSR